MLERPLLRHTRPHHEEKTALMPLNYPGDRPIIAPGRLFRDQLTANRKNTGVSLLFSGIFNCAFLGALATIPIPGGSQNRVQAGPYGGHKSYSIIRVIAESLVS